MHFAVAAVVAAAAVAGSVDVVAVVVVALVSPSSVAVVAVVALVAAVAVALASVDFDTVLGKRVVPQYPDAVPSDGLYTVGGTVVHRAYILEIHGPDQHIQRMHCTIVLHDFLG